MNLSEKSFLANECLSVCLYMECNKDKESFVFAVFRGVLFLSEWTECSLSAIKLLGFCD